MIIRTGRLLVASAAIIGVALYFAFKPEPAPTGVHLEAEPAHEVAKEKTAPVIVDFVQAYNPAVKKKLKLPTSVQLDSAKHVVSSAEAPADERAHTITTVLDVNTGEFTSYDRAETLPWIAPSTKTEVGVIYGLRNGSQAIRIQAQQEFLQIKALRVGAVASVDAGSGGVDSFIGVGAWARW